MKFQYTEHLCWYFQELAVDTQLHSKGENTYLYLSKYTYALGQQYVKSILY